MNKPVFALALLLCAVVADVARSADEPDDPHHHGAATAADTGPATHVMNDARLLVKYPEPLRVHTLANMRDHLQTMGDIQEALSAGSFDKASELAEHRLGMSSLEMHGAHEVAKYMPKAMQDAGASMHHSASQFALVAKDASVTGDLRSTLASLHRLNQTCVACHAAFRLQ